MPPDSAHVLNVVGPRHGSPASSSKLATALMLAPVIRVITRMDIPSTSMPRICARFAVDSLFNGVTIASRETIRVSRISSILVHRRLVLSRKTRDDSSTLARVGHQHGNPNACRGGRAGRDAVPVLHARRGRTVRVECRPSGARRPLSRRAKRLLTTSPSYRPHLDATDQTSRRSMRTEGFAL